MLCPEVQGGGQATSTSGRVMGSHEGTRGSCVCAGCTEGGMFWELQLYPEHLAPRTLWRLQWGVPVIADHQPVYSFLGQCGFSLGGGKMGLGFSLEGT